MRKPRATLLVLIGTLLPAMLLASARPQAAAGCEYWVAPAGNDSAAGTAAAPWATLAHAADALPDDYCTVWFEDGEYAGSNRVNRRFTTVTLFRAIHPYQAVFTNDGPVLSLSGTTNVTLDGFVFRHTGPAATPLVVQIDGSAAGYGERITLRNNIFHDSYNNDLLKIVSGARLILIENNVFYNQGPTDEHIDVNSVSDVVIQDNIFFNDYAGSGRENPATGHSYITIKDSDEAADGRLGSERITVRRNVFLNWEGGLETLIQVGNDGKPYHEARDVRLENNLFIGNSANNAYAVLGLRGVRDVIFANNTVVGDFPSSAYAMWIDLKNANPVNINLTFTNNIWSDPTGSMGSYFMDTTDNEFSKGNPLYALNAAIDNNLYWNGSAAIPGGDLLVPLVDDVNALAADPALHIFQDAVTLPRWEGGAFLSGSATIRQEFVRLVETYARPAAGSPAIGAAKPETALADDILGRARSSTPDLGAYEYFIDLAGRPAETTIEVSWSQPNEAGAAELMLAYTTDGQTEYIRGIAPAEREFTLPNLRPRTPYVLQLFVLDAAGQTLAETTPLTIETTGHRWCLPFLISSQTGSSR
jgi:hypothetical protein